MIKHEGMIGSPYAVWKLRDPKEKLFEQIRKDQFPDRCSRSESVFLFGSHEDAQRANTEWFDGGHVILEAHLVGPGRITSHDAIHLNACEEDWPNSARKYWSGVFTETPLIEVLAECNVRLTGWEPYFKRRFA